MLHTEPAGSHGNACCHEEIKSHGEQCDDCGVVRHDRCYLVFSTCCANDASSCPQSPVLSKTLRISARRSPNLSSRRCSSSTRVKPLSCEMKRTSISVFNCGSY